MSDDLRRMATGLPPKPPGKAGEIGRMLPPGKRPKDYTPVEWDIYWEDKDALSIDGDSHSYYSMGNANAECVLFLIHGGGFSGFICLITDIEASVYYRSFILIIRERNR